MKLVCGGQLNRYYGGRGLGDWLAHSSPLQSDFMQSSTGLARYGVGEIRWDISYQGSWR